METLWKDGKICVEYHELQASAMGIDREGQLVMLAGRRILALLNLDRPDQLMMKVPRSNKWEIGVAVWGPLPECADKITLSCNQICELHQHREGSLTKISNFYAHTRSICDIDWHKFDAHLLATCSMDSYIYVWDIRTPDRPIYSLTAVASANQVKWNKICGQVFATSHEGDVRLWDLRNLNSPTLYITAHISKIHSLDWSPFHKNIMVTSSQDFNFKFFNTDAPRIPEHTQKTDLPVYKARFTPFPGGLMTVLMPQFTRESSLLLWNCEHLSNLSVLHTLEKFPSAVLDFEWRKCNDSHDFHLVTWSKDFNLRIWKMNQQLLKLCRSAQVQDAFEAPMKEFQSVKDASASDLEGLDCKETKVDSKSVNETTPNSETRTSDQFSQDTGKGSANNESVLQPQSLKQEFALINTAIDLQKGSCRISGDYKNHKAFLKVVFPPTYPCNSAPSFHVMSGTTLNDAEKSKVLKVLQDTAMQCVKKNRNCLEPCIRQLNLTVLVLGQLVCFARPSFMKKAGNADLPRSLSALSAYISNLGTITGNYIFRSQPQSPSNEANVSVSYYYQDRHFWGKWVLKLGGSPYHTYHVTDIGVDTWLIPKQSRSNSWSLEELKVENAMIENESTQSPKYDFQFLKSNKSHVYDCYKQAYGEILYRWQLLESRAQVLKYLTHEPCNVDSITFVVVCPHCKHDIKEKTLLCHECNLYAFKCVLCHLPVKGSSNFCLICGHGGHAMHILQWFEKQTVCPAGCGCSCTNYGALT